METEPHAARLLRFNYPWLPNRRTPSLQKCKTENIHRQPGTECGIVLSMPISCLRPRFVHRPSALVSCAIALSLAPFLAAQQPADTGAPPIVLHAARLLQVDTGTLLQPGEVLVE